MKTDGPQCPEGQTRVTTISQLTDRQQEVARLIVKGKFPGEIADELGCSVKTVDTHRAAVLGRLGVRNNVELLLLMIRTGELAR